MMYIPCKKEPLYIPEAECEEETVECSDLFPTLPDCKEE